MSWNRPADLMRLDPAVIYTMLYRALAIVTGPITVLVIAVSFTPEQQGYYFTLTAILTMQTLLELGLGTALQQFASHEWAHLALGGDGSVTGDSQALERLSSLAKFALRWYACAGLVAAGGLALGGLYFVGCSSAPVTFVWRGPWLVLAAVTGASLFLVPGWSILEGCNQVTEVYRYRAIQGTLVRVLLWAALLGGAGLWALVLERSATVLLSVWFFARRYRVFFRALLSRRSRAPRLWRREIWPLQWRFAVVWLSGYLPSLFTPAIFAFQGAVAAGRLGMTLTLTSSLIALADPVISARMPRWAVLIARGRFDELDSQFRQSLRTCLALLAAGSLIFMGILVWLSAAGRPLADRFLAPGITGVFFAAIFFQQARQALGAYLRAHKREPYLALSIVNAVLTAGVVFVLGTAYGVTGIATGFLLVAGIVLLPAIVIFRRRRRDWHAIVETSYRPEVSGRR